MVILRALLIASVLPVLATAQDISRPQDTITRAEGAALLAKEFFEERYIQSFANTTFFKDVRSSDWFAGPLGALQVRGIMKGDLARPHEPMTRSEYLYILFRIRNKNIGSFLDNKQFAEDVAPLTEEYTLFSDAIALNLITAKDNLLRPSQHLSRKEAAHILSTFNNFQKGNTVETQKEAFWREISLAKAGDEMASARSILLVNGLQKMRDDNETQAMVKLSWALGKKLQGDTESAQKFLDQVRELHSDVFQLYDDAKEKTTSTFSVENFSEFLTKLRPLLKGAFML